MAALGALAGYSAAPGLAISEHFGASGEALSRAVPRRCCLGRERLGRATRR